ncbi:energy-coupling factor transporter transmembrane protein EcfT [Geothrix sp. 21YS21S-4]|uniref:energy-coupling factor transporter transmembrane component T family protein n=1 Tax=Geothrix sp. 21YS21S-4 TaxID=3068889 RepID=UPI0027B9B579|nr:energy-coupling factor transporter transmembrane component T [Geothrix sp. 21YS21S-4]
MRASFTSSDGPLTPLHRLDVRTKMLLSLACSVAVIALGSPAALGLLAAATGTYLALTRRWRIILVAHAGVLAVWLLALGFTMLLRKVSPQLGRSDGASLGVPFLRILILLHALLALALTSRIQGILTALKSLRLPYWIYIPAAIMVRFIPSLVEDLRQVAEAARIRGLPLNPAALLRRPWRSVRVFFVPMLFRALRTADELGVAAELKGVHARSVLSPYRQGRFRRLDVAALGLSLGLLAATFVVNARTPHQPVVRH